MINLVIKQDKDDINLMPMLDCILIILVFLMLAVGQTISNIEIMLPKIAETNNITKVDNQELLIYLGKEANNYAVNDHKFNNIDEFKKFILNNLNNQKRVTILGDKNLSLQKFLNVLTFLQANNIMIANIATEIISE